MGTSVKEGYRFEAGPTWCKMSKEDRSVTLDVVKSSLWVDVRAYTTVDGARNADAKPVAPVVSELLVEPSSRSGPPTPSIQTSRAPRGPSAQHLDSSEHANTVGRVASTGVGHKNTDVASRTGERCD